MLLKSSIAITSLLLGSSSDWKKMLNSKLFHYGPSSTVIPKNLLTHSTAQPMLSSTSSFQLLVSANYVSGPTIIVVGILELDLKYYPTFLILLAISTSYSLYVNTFAY